MKFKTAMRKYLCTPFTLLMNFFMYKEDLEYCFCKMFVVICTVYFYIYVFMTCCIFYCLCDTRYCLCDTRIHEMRVCTYVCMYCV